MYILTGSLTVVLRTDCAEKVVKASEKESRQEMTWFRPE